jgi:predicted transposase YdaD
MIKTAAQRLREEGRKEGREEGLKEGWEVGVLMGHILELERILGKKSTPREWLLGKKRAELEVILEYVRIEYRAH